jgi:acyl-CoA thioester hydrolase
MFPGFKTKLNLRVDWSELDLFGHVNNVSIFKYVQAARVNYCGLLDLATLEKTGRSFMVASTSCQFKKPVTFPGEVCIHTKISWIKNSSFQLDHCITGSAQEILAEATDVLVFFDHLQQVKLNIDDTLLKKMELLEGRKLQRAL